MEISQTGLLGVNGSAAAASSETLAQTFDNFLMLLTTQLQNQDPLSPMESTEFTSQLVQFASVEQQITQNKNLEALVALQRSNQAVSALGFLGTTVEAFGNEMMLESSAAEFNYTLLADTEVVKITILDEDDNPVRTIEGDPSVGKHNFVWDGLDDQGIQRPDGIYKILVTALDADGNLLDSATTTIGTVTGVAAQDGAVVVKFGEISVPIANVLAVTETAAGQTTQTAAP